MLLPGALGVAAMPLSLKSMTSGVRLWPAQAHGPHTDRHTHRPYRRGGPRARRRSPTPAANPSPGPRGRFCDCWLHTTQPTPARGARRFGVRMRRVARRWEEGNGRSKWRLGAGATQKVSRTSVTTGRASKVLSRCATWISSELPAGGLFRCALRPESRGVLVSLLGGEGPALYARSRQGWEC